MTTAASLATLEPETAAFDVTVRVVRKLMEASAGGTDGGWLADAM